MLVCHTRSFKDLTDIETIINEIHSYHCIQKVLKIQTIWENVMLSGADSTRTKKVLCQDLQKGVL